MPPSSFCMCSRLNAVASRDSFVAFGIKLGLFPFHFWLPTVYTGARPAVAAILSGALANIGTYGLLRFGADIFPRELAEASGVLLVLGAARDIHVSASNRVHAVLDRVVGRPALSHRIHDGIAAGVYAGLGFGLRASAKAMLLPSGSLTYISRLPHVWSVGARSMGTPRSTSSASARWSCRSASRKACATSSAPWTPAGSRSGTPGTT